MPAEPPPTRWQFPPADTADENGIVGIGADLEPGTLLRAYRSGIFPMPLGPDGPMAWWSPDPRGVIPLDGLRVSRSLRRSCRRYRTTIDEAFDDVVAACSAPRPHGGDWISDEIRDAYRRMHRVGWAHSVEVWDDEGALAGGLYGIAVGGLFAGESMFHRRRDASKVALVRLVDELTARGIEGRVLDVQWVTDHLASLGAVPIARSRYVELVRDAVGLPLPPAFDR